MQRTAKVSRSALREAVREAQGNLSRAAASLNMSRPTLYKLLAIHDLYKYALVREREEMKPTSQQHDLRVQRSVSMTDSLWAWARHHAIDAKKTTSEVIEEALEAYKASQVMTPEK